MTDRKEVLDRWNAGEDALKKGLVESLSARAAEFIGVRPEFGRNAVSLAMMRSFRVGPGWDKFRKGAIADMSDYLDALTKLDEEMMAQEPEEGE